MNKPISIGIVGSGTAGLISALLFRKAFPNSEITILSSSQIGIIGVGEGSTEHWRSFMDQCNIPTEEMINNCAATHKYGIRFENWTNHTPDYFHSVGGQDDIFVFGPIALYMGLLEQDKLFTNSTVSAGLTRNKISRMNLHKSTNQFHFDTFKLNEYLTSLCFRRGVKFIDGIVKTVDIDSENGCIKSVTTDKDEVLSSYFWIDASGFSKVLMKELDNTEWVSYSKYLYCDSAIAFPTESDPNGEIRGYTRAIAASGGWMWEIPTQQRRGNGYVFSSQFTTEEEAIEEAKEISGYKDINPRKLSFTPGYLKNSWVKNCAAVGLASSFVEPLEATSIGSTIQQVKNLIPNIASYAQSSTKIQKVYNKSFEKLMDNILTMIRLHYMSDRTDSPFWIEQSSAPLNEGLEELIDMWSERPPSRFDFAGNNGEMFLTPHFAHVMQGQGLLDKKYSSIAIDNFGIRESVAMAVDEFRNSRHNHELVDHKKALEEIGTLDEEW